MSRKKRNLAEVESSHQTSHWEFKRTSLRGFSHFCQRQGQQSICLPKYVSFHATMHMYHVTSIVTDHKTMNLKKRVFAILTFFFFCSQVLLDYPKPLSILSCLKSIKQGSVKLKRKVFWSLKPFYK